MTGALFGLAILAAIARAYIRARILKQIAIEDGILLFAILCLSATTVLHYVTTSYLYIALRTTTLSPGSQLEDSLRGITIDTKKEYAIGILWWLVIFSVKLAYLVFFRKLVLHLRALTIWWWCVIAFMVFPYHLHFQGKVAKQCYRYPLAPHVWLPLIPRVRSPTYNLFSVSRLATSSC